MKVSAASPCPEPSVSGQGSITLFINYLEQLLDRRNIADILFGRISPMPRTCTNASAERG
jgi:hypothetical protein